MWATVHGPCLVLELLALGLRIQYGSERRSRDLVQHTMEWIQLQDVSRVEEALGSVAWDDRGMGRTRNELGAVGFPPTLGIAGCTQSMAFGNGGANCVVVQVSGRPLAVDDLLTMPCPSFLIKDAQQDIAGARLKA